MELFDANRQWSTRPKDQTFFNLKDAYDAAYGYAAVAHEKADVNPATLRTEALNGEVVLVGRGNTPAQLTHWSFGQLSQRAFPHNSATSFLRALPATLAVQNLNHGLKTRYEGGTDERVNMLVQANGKLLVRAFNSERFSRIWNHELLKRLLTLENWHNPVPFNKGEQEAATYVSDHDMFTFQVNDSNLIEAGNGRQLRRGFIMSNSEVGAAKWKTLTFLFDFMCRNHIIWGAEHVSEIAVRHVGNASQRMDELMAKFEVQLKRYADSSGSLEEAKIKAAKNLIFKGDKDAVIDEVFKRLRGTLVTRKAIEGGVDTAHETPDTDGSPSSAWAIANGMTRYSQTIPYADQRIVVDRAAGKLVEQAF